MVGNMTLVLIGKLLVVKSGIRGFEFLVYYDNYYSSGIIWEEYQISIEICIHILIYQSILNWNMSS